MTISLSSFNAAIQNNPVREAIVSQCESGITLNHVIVDENTGDVLVSENGGPYEPAHAFIKAMMTGSVYRDPGKLNPIASHAVRRSPRRKATHDAEVVSMMRYLIDYYRADLLTHPAFDRVLEEMTAVSDSPAARRRLSALNTNYDRWDLLIASVVDSLGRQ